jgi:hypothetical protein
MARTSLGSWIVAGIAVAIAARFFREAQDTRQRLRQTAPYLVRAGLTPEEASAVAGLGEWAVVDKGGSQAEGDIGGRGLCPCQHDWTVNSTFVPLPGGRPARAAIPGLLNYPAPRPAVWECPEDCVQVLTHLWKGWLLEVNGNVWQLVCSTNAQYHCKKPDDPDRSRPPIEGPPVEN